MTEAVLEKKEVLIVDDQPENLTVLRKMLFERDYLVRASLDGQLALDTAKASPPDLILLDIMMPGMDGYQVCRRLKEDENLRDIPVIFLSALSDTTDKLRGFGLGAVDYITKPFQSEEVLARVKTHLDLKAAREALQEHIRERDKLLAMQEAAFSAIPETVVTVDQDLRIISANREHEDICAQFGDEGMFFQEKLYSGAGPCSRLILETLRSRRPVRDYEIDCACTAPNRCKLVLNCAPLVSSEDHFLGATLVIRDITRQDELEKILSDRQSARGIVGKSKSMQNLYLFLEQTAYLDDVVLITGEKGVGKESVAEAVHYAGRRREKPLIKVNCASVSEELLNALLFGRAGDSSPSGEGEVAGQLAAAEGGTIFLNEIGNISIKTQESLLRFLEHGEFTPVGGEAGLKADVRVIASTDQDLMEKVRQGAFLKDLYFFLRSIVISLPPLRERLEDVPLLAGHFLREFRDKQAKDIEAVSDSVLRIFLNYDWPGNILELRQCMEQAVLACTDGWILPEHLPEKPGALPPLDKDSKNNELLFSPDVDKDALIEALAKHQWNKIEAAKELGLSSRTLTRYMERYILDILRHKT